MNYKMLEYFRRKLLKWRKAVLEESNQTLKSLANDTIREADLADSFLIFGCPYTRSRVAVELAKLGI